MKVIIAEKPDMMKKIIKAIEKKAVTFGKGYAFSQGTVYTHAVGHLVILANPGEVDEKYKSWNLDLLPFHFNKIPLKTKDSTKDQFKVIEQILQKDNLEEIINACDADREGELIFRNIIEKIRPKCTNISRMWITSTTDEGIQQAFKNRMNSKEYDNLARAAKARSYADYMVGLNGTMAMTSSFAGYRNVLTVGRVQTPTLRIIVDLEKEINNFIPEKYYKVKAHTQANTGAEFEGEYQNKELEDNKFKDKAIAQKMIDDLGNGPAKVIAVENKTRKEPPKMLFNLSDLQIEMNKRYNMGAQMVLDIAQALYEKHSLITYPRTDENRVSEEFAERSYEILKGLPFMKEFANEIIENKWQINKKMVVNKTSIGSHEAITPVLGKVDIETLKSLRDAEKKVYAAIVERFIAAFYPDAVLEQQTITYKRKHAEFVSKTEVVKSLGYYKVANKNKTVEDLPLNAIEEGDVVIIKELEIIENETKPPARFTEGSLIKMMKNPIKYTESKEEKEILKQIQGIGTEATRAGIIENLKNRNFIFVQDKKIIPTEKGIKLIELIPSETLKSVSLTAEFESKLNEIAEGKLDVNKFMEAIYRFDKNLIEEIKAVSKNTDIKKIQQEMKSNKLCNCPNCDGDILESKYGYYCSNKCGVSIYRNALEKVFGYKEIKKGIARELLTDGITKRKVKLYSKNKDKEFSAKLTYEFKKGEKYPNNVWIHIDTDRPSK